MAIQTNATGTDVPATNGKALRRRKRINPDVINRTVLLCFQRKHFAQSPDRTVFIFVCSSVERMQSTCAVAITWVFCRS